MNIEHLSDKHQLDYLEKKLLTYLVDYPEPLSKLGIRKAAQDNNTSISTIIRLAKKLHFEGYTDMVYHIIFSRNQKKETTKGDLFTISTEMVRQYSGTFRELFQKYQSKKVVVFGLGYSQLIANYINEKLLINGWNSISNTHLQLFSEAHQGEVLLIFISQSGETPRALDIIKNASQNGIDIISFIGNAGSSAVSCSALPIIINAYNQLGDLQYMPNTFFGETILLFEYLYSDFLENLKQCNE